MIKGLKAKLIGDKRYLSQKLFEDLFKAGVTFMTKIKKNMKNRLMGMTYKLMLMKRSFIQALFYSIKSLNTFVHHRHRSSHNAFVHLFVGLIHYQFRTDKPSLHQLLLLNP